MTGEIRATLQSSASGIVCMYLCVYTLREVILDGNYFCESSKF